MTGPRATALAALAALALQGHAARDQVGAAGGSGSPPGPGAAAGAEEWSRIAPGGETTCAHGGPYAFWARVDDPERLLVFLEGGGGCWSAETCREGSDWFDAVVTRDDDPSGAGGVLDPEHPENPFRGWSMLYVPYCTGDVHWGDNVRTYEDSLGRVTVRHKGFVNASAALDWMRDRLPGARQVAVLGCSAGSVGSILHVPYVVARWPEARVMQLGDAEAFVFDRPVDVQSGFGAHDNFPDVPDLDEIEPGDFTIERFYAAVARHHPEVTFAQVTTAHDSVQIRYFEAVATTPRDGEGVAGAPGMSASAGHAGASGARPRPPGPPPPGAWEEAMNGSLAAIHASAPNFRSFVAAGHAHCATPHDGFHRVTSGGVRLRDWVQALVDGEPAGDVRCAGCEELPGSARTRTRAAPAPAEAAAPGLGEEVR